MRAVTTVFQDNREILKELFDLMAAGKSVYITTPGIVEAKVRLGCKYDITVGRSTSVRCVPVRSATNVLLKKFECVCDILLQRGS